jgi:hypothetical protein
MEAALPALIDFAGIDAVLWHIERYGLVSAPSRRAIALAGSAICPTDSDLQSR